VLLSLNSSTPDAARKNRCEEKEKGEFDYRGKKGLHRVLGKGNTMKIVIRMCIFAFMLSVFVASELKAQEDVKQLLSSQLIGTWTGVILGPSKTRTLEIKEVRKRDATDGRTFEATGFYGITGMKLVPITLEIGLVEGVTHLAFVTSEKSRIALTSTNIRRMDGTFTDAKGQQLGFRLWKSDGAPVTDPALTPLLGTWDGKWTSGLITHMRMDFIDATGTSITYAWEDSPMNGKAGWGRYNAKVLEGSTIEFVMAGRFTHSYSLSTFFGKYLRGDCQPCNGNSVVWSPSTTFPKTE
jgi:hypothetical protein